MAEVVEQGQFNAANPEASVASRYLCQLLACYYKDVCRVQSQYAVQQLGQSRD